MDDRDYEFEDALTDAEWEPCTLRDDDWELDHGLSRIEYLRLLIEGYRKDGKQAPREVLDEYEPLATAEALERIEAARKRDEAARAEVAALEERKRVERERNEGPESALEEHWSNQRQLGKTKAAEAWAEKHGVELPVILESAETEEEMREAIRKLKNVGAAKKTQGLKKGAWTQPKDKQGFKGYKKPK